MLTAQHTMKSSTHSSHAADGIIFWVVAEKSQLCRQCQKLASNGQKSTWSSQS